MFDMSQISTYLVPSIVILCLCVGYVIKNLVPNDSVNRYIPLIVAVVGLVAGVASTMSAGLPVTLDVVVGSVVSGISSTGFQQMFKQFISGGSAPQVEDSVPEEDSDDGAKG